MEGRRCDLVPDQVVRALCHVHLETHCASVGGRGRYAIGLGEDALGAALGQLEEGLYLAR